MSIFWRIPAIATLCMLLPAVASAGVVATKCSGCGSELQWQQKAIGQGVGQRYLYDFSSRSLRKYDVVGTYEPELQVFAGPLALAPLTQLRVQTLFLAISSIRDGTMRISNGHEVEMKQALIKVADRVVLLADSSKFEYSALMMVAALGILFLMPEKPLRGHPQEAAPILPE